MMRRCCVEPLCVCLWKRAAMCVGTTTTMPCWWWRYLMLKNCFKWPCHWFYALPGVFIFFSRMQIIYIYFVLESIFTLELIFWSVCVWLWLTHHGSDKIMIRFNSNQMGAKYTFRFICVCSTRRCVSNETPSVDIRAGL